MGTGHDCGLFIVGPHDSNLHGDGDSGSQVISRELLRDDGSLVAIPHGGRRFDRMISGNVDKSFAFSYRPPSRPSTGLRLTWFARGSSRNGDVQVVPER
jgi:hypothetical protein